MSFFFNKTLEGDEKIEQYQVKPYEDSGSQIIIEAINVGRKYMRTLVQANKFSDRYENGSTGLLPVRLDILEDRLYQIGELIGYIKEARQSRNYSLLVEKLPQIYKKIEYGTIPCSTLRRNVERFFERVNRLSTDEFNGYTYDECLEKNIKSKNDDGYICNISFLIMKNPVYVEPDKCWYDLKNIS